MGQTLDYFCKGIEFTQSHQPEGAISDSYDKREPGLRRKILLRCSGIRTFGFESITNGWTCQLDTKSHSYRNL